jgi:hypothetical protein
LVVVAVAAHGVLVVVVLGDLELVQLLLELDLMQL